MDCGPAGIDASGAPHDAAPGDTATVVGHLGARRAGLSPVAPADDVLDVRRSCPADTGVCDAWARHAAACSPPMAEPHTDAHSADEPHLSTAAETNDRMPSSPCSRLRDEASEAGAVTAGEWRQSVATHRQSDGVESTLSVALHNSAMAEEWHRGETSASPRRQGVDDWNRNMGYDSPVGALDGPAGSGGALDGPVSTNSSEAPPVNKTPPRRHVHMHFAVLSWHEIVIADGDDDADVTTTTDML